MPNDTALGWIPEDDSAHATDESSRFIPQVPYVMEGLGWVPDIPSTSDATPETHSVKQMLGKAGVKYSQPSGLDSSDLPNQVDLRQHFPPVYNQLKTNSCTANAACGLVMYFEKKSYNKIVSPSRLFLYKASRNLLFQPEDKGAYNRTTFQALTFFGVPPEQYWPFNTELVNAEPNAFCYSFATTYQAVAYYRYDPPGRSKADVLQLIKSQLFAQLPAMFGFQVHNSISQAFKDGKIPFPGPINSDPLAGGHAIVAVGYDDQMQITNTATDETTTGAILIRNSWGNQWGENGYGWLPYKYILSGIATDWWSLLSMNFVDTGQFGFGKDQTSGDTTPTAEDVTKKTETKLPKKTEK